MRRRTRRTRLWSDIGVLTRDNAHAEEVFDALTAAGIPVEIVGLSGLLRLPEVAEVVAMLHLLHDVTANASLLTLLTGPRWAIGPRDLRLLGRARRARSPARQRPRCGARRPSTDHLLAIADGHRPGRDPALDDALARPRRRGVLPRGAGAVRAARRRAAACCARHVGEPLLDVVRRIIDTTGIDVELASAVSPAAAARRDNLDLFVKAVADFQAVDGDVTLPALLAYLTAEDDQGNGLDVATPTEADSVKLLTVHRSKGLEWDSVFLVGVCETRFPSNRSRTLWTSSPAVLPAPLRGDAADLPQLARLRQGRARRLPRRHPRRTTPRRSCGSGYVAFTRAAHRLSVTSYLLEPAGHAVRPLGLPGGRPRPARGVGRAGRPAGWTSPRRATPTRTPPTTRRGRGRSTGIGRRGARCGSRPRPSWCARPTRRRRRPELDMIEAARVAEWDAELERLLAEARDEPRADDRRARCPRSLSATALARLRDDPEDVRPRPGPADAAAAVAGGPVRHPLPRLGRGAVRPAGRCSTPTTCPAAPTPASTTTPTSRS